MVQDLLFSGSLDIERGSSKALFIFFIFFYSRGGAGKDLCIPFSNQPPVPFSAVVPSPPSLFPPTTPIPSYSHLPPSLILPHTCLHVVASASYSPNPPKLSYRQSVLILTSLSFILTKPVKYLTLMSTSHPIILLMHSSPTILTSPPFHQSLFRPNVLLSPEAISVRGHREKRS